MHFNYDCYHFQTFTKNGQPTITTKSSYFQNIIGNREGLSFQDIKLANLMYDCAAGEHLLPVSPFLEFKGFTKENLFIIYLLITLERKRIQCQTQITPSFIIYKYCE